MTDSRQRRNLGFVGAAACALSVAAPAFAQDAPIQLTGPEVLSLAEAMILRGEIDQAQPLLEALAQSGTDSVDQTQVAFLQGMAAASEGDLVAARDIFRMILETRPELTRVRLELARVLFLLEDDAAATYHFRLALAEAPSDDVRATIESYLNAIESRRTTAFELSVGIAPDSNVNAGTTSDTINLFGFLPSDLSEDAKQTTGLGLKTSFSAAWLPRLSERWRLELRGAGLVSDYGGAKYDDLAGLTEIGVRRLNDRGYWNLAATYDQRWFGGEDFYDAMGLRFSGVRRLTARLFGLGGISVEDYDYTVEDGRDGLVTTVNGGVSYALSSVSLASTRLSVSREEAELEARANTSYALQLGYSREYGNALTLGLTPFAAYRPFDGFDPLLGSTRSDVRYGVQIDGLNREWSYRSFTPAIAYTYTRNESNQVLYDYERHQFEFRLTRVF